MRWIDGLSKAQRVVIVVALGFGLRAAGRYLVSLGGGPRFRFGWYTYSSLTADFRAPGTGLPAWLRLIIWLALIVLWAAASVRVLRQSSGQATPD